MRRAIGTVGKSGQVLTVRLDAGRHRDGAARESGENESPPMSSGGRQSHKFETRISAIADFARKGKRKKKALPLFPVPTRAPQSRLRGTHRPQYREQPLDILVRVPEMRRHPHRLTAHRHMDL